MLICLKYSDKLSMSSMLSLSDENVGNPQKSPISQKEKKKLEK